MSGFHFLTQTLQLSAGQGGAKQGAHPLLNPWGKTPTEISGSWTRAHKLTPFLSCPNRAGTSDPKRKTHNNSWLVLFSTETKLLRCLKWNLVLISSQSFYIQVSCFSFACCLETNGAWNFCKIHRKVSNNVLPSCMILRPYKHWAQYMNGSTHKQRS